MGCGTGSLAVLLVRVARAIPATERVLTRAENDACSRYEERPPPPKNDPANSFSSPTKSPAVSCLISSPEKVTTKLRSRLCAHFAATVSVSDVSW